jgi:hypothetical protein
VVRGNHVLPEQELLPRADDGIRTRDPHLGKEINTLPGTLEQTENRGQKRFRRFNSLRLSQSDSYPYGIAYGMGNGGLTPPLRAPAHEASHPGPSAGLVSPGMLP